MREIERLITSLTKKTVAKQLYWKKMEIANLPEKVGEYISDSRHKLQVETVYTSGVNGGWLYLFCLQKDPCNLSARFNVEVSSFDLGVQPNKESILTRIGFNMEDITIVNEFGSLVQSEVEKVSRLPESETSEFISSLLG